VGNVLEDGDKARAYCWYKGNQGGYQGFYIERDVTSEAYSITFSNNQLYVAGFINQSIEQAMIWQIDPSSNTASRYLTLSSPNFSKAQSLISTKKSLYVAGYENQKATLWKVDIQKKTPQKLLLDQRMSYGYSITSYSSLLYIAGSQSNVAEYWTVSINTPTPTLIPPPINLDPFGGSSARGITYSYPFPLIAGYNYNSVPTLWYYVKTNEGKIALDVPTEFSLEDENTQGTANNLAFGKGSLYIAGEKQDAATLWVCSDPKNISSDNIKSINLDDNGQALNIYIPLPAPLTTSLKFQSPYKYQR
jgi:hypothetical protein